MEELKKEVYAAALAVFGAYLRRQDAARSAYLAIGMNYIRFATEERELFRLLFMSDFGQTDVMAARVEMEYILGVIGESGAVSDENAQTVYRDMWLFSHGIAAMMATGTANFTEAEAEKMLSDVYAGWCRIWKEKSNKTEGVSDEKVRCSCDRRRERRAGRGDPPVTGRGKDAAGRKAQPARRLCDEFQARAVRV